MSKTTYRINDNKNTVVPYDDTLLSNRVKALEDKTDNDKQILSISEHQLSISNGNTVVIPDNQTITVNRGLISIENGNTTELPNGNTRELTKDDLVKLPENRIIEAYKTGISVLNGKKILFVGDSLTEVNFRTNRGYVESLKTDKGIEAINNGSSGYGYSTKDESFMGADRDSCDAFVIFLGINDFGNVSRYNLPLDIVLKCVKRMISKACLQAGNRPIGVILPMNNINTLKEKLGEGGYSLKQLVEGIKKTVDNVSKQYNMSIPILDLYSLDPLDVTKRSLEDGDYIKNYFTNNGRKDIELLHPNDAGWDIITKYISYWLENTFTFHSKKTNSKTLQVIERNDGNLEINTTTSPIKYDNNESNAYNRGKFRIPTFGDGSYTYSLRNGYTDKSKYKMTFVINDEFTFDTDYHPVATDFNQQFYYFDVDSISTNPTDYLAENNVKSVMKSRNCDEKEAKYILNLMKLFKRYIDGSLFTTEEKSTYKSMNTSSVPFPMKIVIEKR